MRKIVGYFLVIQLSKHRVFTAYGCVNVLLFPACERISYCSIIITTEKTCAVYPAQVNVVQLPRTILLSFPRIYIVSAKDFNASTAALYTVYTTTSFV